MTFARDCGMPSSIRPAMACWLVSTATLRLMGTAESGSSEDQVTYTYTKAAAQPLTGTATSSSFRSSADTWPKDRGELLQSFRKQQASSHPSATETSPSRITPLRVRPYDHNSRSDAVPWTDAAG